MGAIGYSGSVPSGTSVILKTIYDKQGIQDACYADTTLLKQIKKVEAGGKAYNQVVRQARIGGGGPVFATALTSSTAMTDQEFIITKTKYYLPWTISRELMAQSKGGGDKAYVDALKDAIDCGLKAAANDIEQQLWLSGTGSIGQISATSNVATTTITLANIEDVVHFEVGDIIYAHATDGGAARVGGTGYVTLSAVDRAAGTLSIASSTWSGQITAPVAAGDYLTKAGHLNATVTGVLGWITPGTPGVLFGVTRTSDRSRLAGVSVTATGLAVDDAILNLAARMAREGVRGNISMFVSPNKYNSLAKSVRQNQYFMNSSKGEVGFSSIKFPTPAGVWDVQPATFCPDSYGLALDLATWKILDFGGGVPEIVQDDGNILFRDYGTDSYSVRIAAYLQLCCSNPAKNGVVTF